MKKAVDSVENSIERIEIKATVPPRTPRRMLMPGKSLESSDHRKFNSIKTPK